MLTQTKRDVHITRFHFVWRIHTEIQLVFQVFKARVKIIVWLFLYDFSMGDAKENHQRAFHWIEQILLSLEVHLQTLIWSGVVSALSLNWTKWGSGILTAQDPRLQLYSLCHLWSKILSFIDLPLGNQMIEVVKIDQSHEDSHLLFQTRVATSWRLFCSSSVLKDNFFSCAKI